MLWNCFEKPDDLHHSTLGHFYLIQFHAPAQEYYIVFSLIQISLYLLPITTRLSLLWMLNKQSWDITKTVLLAIRKLSCKSCKYHLIASNLWQLEATITYKALDFVPSKKNAVSWQMKKKYAKRLRFLKNLKTQIYYLNIENYNTN